MIQSFRQFHSRIGRCTSISGVLALALIAGCTASDSGGSGGGTGHGTAAAPQFSPDPGAYTGSQAVAITEATPNATVYYTTDGSTPTTSSTAYSGPVTISSTTTFSAIATAVGYTSSPLTRATFTITAQVTAPPAFTPPAGSYNTAQSVTLASATPGASIYYTTDGSTPTTKSTPFKDPIQVAMTSTISAIAVATGYAASPVATAIYKIALPSAAAPTFSPVPGSYTSAQTVSLAETTPGAIIYYTTDGSVPSSTSTVYTAPIPVSSTTTISAIAYSSGLAPSSVATGVYTLALPQLSAPTMSPVPGTYTGTQHVTLTSTVPGTTIYYTTDGTTPDMNSTQYNGPITVSATSTIKSIATHSGYTTSAVASGTYTIDTATATYTFKSVQIVGGGFVTGILFHPGQQGLLYARTDVGGAYRRDPGATSWTPLLDFLTRDQSNYMGVESMAIDPTDLQKLYLAVGTYADTFGSNGAVLLSSDQGRTFTIVPMPFKMGANDKGRFAGERLSVDPNLPSHLYLGSRLNGLWESTDSGHNWKVSTTFPVQGTGAANPGTTGGVIFEIFVKSSGVSGSRTPTIYAGVDDSTLPALYSSNDGGATWAAVTGQPTGLFLNHGELGPDGNIYLTYANNLGPEGASGGGIWRYTPPTAANTAGVWQNITAQPSFTSNPGTYGYGSIATDPSHPGVVMATTLDLYYLHDDVFRSLDGGNSWIDLGGNQRRDASLSPWINFGATSTPIGNWLVGLAIDPYDGSHALYGTGQTIWESTGAAAADSTPTTAGTTTAGLVPTNWSIGAQGVEEAVLRTLICPPSGAPLISGMRDIGDFTHQVLDASPSAGMNTNPLLTDTTGLDFAELVPGTLARVGDGNPAPFGGTSIDGGRTWRPFASQAGSAAGGGSVALAADGTTVLWSPEDAGVYWSTNNGTAWTASVGAPQQQPVVSDRQNASKFYIFDSNTGTLYRSTDAGHNFAPLTTGLPVSGLLRASFAAEGDLWLATGAGIEHSTDSGVTFQLNSAFSEAWDIAFGKIAAGSNYPTIFVYGRLGGVSGVYRSTDAGNTWTPVTDTAHQYGYLNTIAADRQTFGRVYLGTSGRGIIYADPAQ